MKNALLSILFLLLTSILWPQSYNVEWGEVTSNQGKALSLMPSKKGEFYALRWVGGRMLGGYQVSFHKDLKLIRKKKIRLTVNKSIATYEGARVLNGKFVLFLSDKRDGNNNLFMQTFSDELEQPEKSIKLAEYELSINKGEFRILQSPDKKYIGVAWYINPKRGEREVYGFKVFDSLLNLVNEGEYPLPFEADLSTINTQIITNSGDYLMAVTEYQKNEKGIFFKNQLNYKALHVLRINDDGLQDFQIDLKERRVEAISMAIGDNNNFIVTGIYGDKGEYGIKGVFHQRIDLKTEEKIDERFQEFEKSFITQGWSERQIEKAKKRQTKGKGEPQLYNYIMKDITILKDGSIVGTMEQYYVQVNANTDYRTGTVSQSYYYYYNDIIAYKINPVGDISWVKKIIKEQISSNDEGLYSSYESFIDNGKVHFIFNDHIKNYDSNLKFIEHFDIYPANYSRTKNAVGLASIDLENGDIKREAFLSRSKMNALILPKLFNVNYSTGELIIYSIAGRKEKLGVIQFKD